MIHMSGIDQPAAKLKLASAGARHGDRGVGLLVIGFALISVLSRRPPLMIHPKRDVRCGLPSALKPHGSHHVPELEKANLLAKSDTRQLTQNLKLKPQLCKKRYSQHIWTIIVDIPRTRYLELY